MQGVSYFSSCRLQTQVGGFQVHQQSGLAKVSSTSVTPLKDLQPAGTSEDMVVSVFITEMINFYLVDSSYDNKHSCS